MRSLAALLSAELLDCDTVHVGSAFLGEGLAHGDASALLGLVLGLTNEASSLQLLEAVADVLTGSEARLLLQGTAVSFASVVLAETLNTALLPHVELVADGGGARVEPIVVKGVQLLVAGSLNDDRPLLNIILIRINWFRRAQEQANAQFSPPSQARRSQTDNLRRGS